MNDLRERMIEAVTQALVDDAISRRLIYGVSEERERAQKIADAILPLVQEESGEKIRGLVKLLKRKYQRIAELEAKLADLKSKAGT